MVLEISLGVGVLIVLALRHRNAPAFRYGAMGFILLPASTVWRYIGDSLIGRLVSPESVAHGAYIAAGESMAAIAVVLGTFFVWKFVRSMRSPKDSGIPVVRFGTT